jgi:hypothetical protein
MFLGVVQRRHVVLRQPRGTICFNDLHRLSHFVSCSTSLPGVAIRRRRRTNDRMISMLTRAAA